MTSQATTLPARYYTDAGIFHQELEQFFFQKWICAGRGEQLASPGDYFLCEVGGESVIVTKDSSGTLRAFYNVCRHRGTRICGETHGTFAGRIQCPYHAWTYGLDGKLLGAPHMEDAGFQHGNYPLHSVDVDTWDGHLFLNLSSQKPQSLAMQLADLPEKFAPWQMQELRIYKRIVYNVKANWKLIVINYNECMHCPVLHPLLSRITNYLSGENEIPNSSYIGGSMGFRDNAQTMSMDGAIHREYLPGLSESARKQTLYYTIYPNLFLSLHPDYMMTHTLWPVAPDATRVICEWHFHPSEMNKPDFQAEDAVAFWDRTNREDWGISELSQLGISSRAYVPGPYSPREALPAAFDKLIVEEARKSTVR
ncbi:MAG TPA: aromatic ring-hydroxylating dioxygenase subunit alpha [Candidatus Acidoferrum sp.]|nr:aromatic ring-hydroxylating dioxygenase subunit alpha [Candidatus Acidoferrum sp.]